MVLKVSKYCSINQVDRVGVSKGYFKSIYNLAMSSHDNVNGFKGTEHPKPSLLLLILFDLQHGACSFKE